MVKTESQPRSLELGLKGLTRIPGCKLSGPVDYDDEGKTWIITLILERKQKTKYIPRRSVWKVLVDENYPYGSVGFYPASEKGITATFPHQERNDPISKPWRGGKLCLDSPFRSLRLANPDRAPFGEPEGYLAWYTRRAIDWLHLAASGELLRENDPFEVPRIPFPNYPRLIFDETPENYRLWGEPPCFGMASIGTIPGVDSKKATAVTAFYGLSGTLVRKWEGRLIEEPDVTDNRAFWWLWPGTIVLPPWYAPRTWGDLRKIGLELGVDVDKVLQFIANRIRGYGGPTLLLIGYPIPKRVGLPPSEVHWDALLLPAIPPVKGSQSDGFESTKRGLWRRDRARYLANGIELTYYRTENWSPARLQARGRLSKPVRETNAVIIGVGALGSCIAELLGRTGITNLTLIDGDIVTAGNACRHVAALADFGEHKAEVLARQLQRISPHVRVTTVNETVGQSPDNIRGLLDQYEAIIDCTAVDDLLSLLARAWWPIPRLFLSTSVGYAARRFYMFAAFANEFPLTEFNAQIEPWLREERQRWAADDELLEGAGCWSPLWPGRYDDIMMAAAVCIKEIEFYLTKPPNMPILDVFEQVIGDEGFQSYTRVSATTLKNEAEAV